MSTGSGSEEEGFIRLTVGQKTRTRRHTAAQVFRHTSTRRTKKTTWCQSTRLRRFYLLSPWEGRQGAKELWQKIGTSTELGFHIGKKKEDVNNWLLPFLAPKYEQNSILSILSLLVSVRDPSFGLALFILTSKSSRSDVLPLLFIIPVWKFRYHDKVISRHFTWPAGPEHALVANCSHPEQALRRQWQGKTAF